MIFSRTENLIWGKKIVREPKPRTITPSLGRAGPQGGDTGQGRNSTGPGSLTRRDPSDPPGDWWEVICLLSISSKVIPNCEVDRSRLCVSQEWPCAYLTTKCIKCSHRYKQLSFRGAPETSKGSWGNDAKQDLTSPQVNPVPTCLWPSSPGRLSRISQGNRTCSLALGLCFKDGAHWNPQ